jgi:hypothetical protein
MALRSEFIHAFVEHAGPGPASERLTVRLPTLITVAALAAVGALVIGVFWNLIRPASATSATPIGLGGAAPTAGAPTSYAAVAGWDCVAAGDHGFEAQGRTSAWQTVALGGWSRDGCHGTFETIPMTGNATADDPQQTAQWWFTPGSGVSHCSVGVYVPASDPAQDAGASAAHYSVLAGRGGTSYADFTVDQSANRGRWVSAGTFPVAGNGLAVQVTDRGVPAHAGDRIAVAQLKVDCSR